jgi:TPR repeat protein
MQMRRLGTIAFVTGALAVLLHSAAWPDADGEKQRAAAADYDSDIQALRDWWYRFKVPPLAVSEWLRGWLDQRPDDPELLFFAGLMQAGSPGIRLGLEDQTWLERMRRASDLGFMPARARLGMAMIAGEGMPKDPQQGLELIREAADAETAEAFMYLGIVKRDGRGGIPVDPDAAREALERAVALGEVRALRHLAEVHLARGDKAAARADMQAGVEAGDPDAAFAVAEWLRHGTVGSQNMTDAVRLTRAAALAGGRGLAACRWAEYLRDGIGCEPDPVEAFEWFTVAAQSGDRTAQYQVALAQLQGAGTAQAPEAAIQQLRTLAHAKHAEACLTLGRLYLEGVLVERDEAEARKLIELAAAKGSTVGKLYAKRLSESAREPSEDR